MKKERKKNSGITPPLLLEHPQWCSIIYTWPINLGSKETNIKDKKYMDQSPEK
jgi:hypothetical protein